MPAKRIKGLIPIFPIFQPLRIKYKDVFDLKLFYKALHDYLYERKWGAHEGLKDELDRWETFYGERIDRGGAREIWTYWRLRREPDDAPFFNFYLDIEFHCIAITNTEIIRDGKKIKANKGEIEMKYYAWLEKKYEKQFENIPVLKGLLTLFTNRIYRKVIEQRKKELYQEVYILANFVKQWFKLKRYLPYEEKKNFFKSYAWPAHVKK